MSATLASYRLNGSCQSSRDLPIREHELQTLQNTLKKGKLCVLTGPKAIGKSTLVRDLQQKDWPIFYVDLKAKDTEEESSSILTTVKLLIEERPAILDRSLITIIIDEAQILDIIGQHDCQRFFNYIASVTRDGKLSLLLVTSDYDSLVRLIGMHLFNLLC